MLLKYSVSSWSILITRVLNCASGRLAISSLLSCIFSGALFCSYIWAICCCCCCCCLGAPVTYKGWSLRCSPGRGNPCHCVVTLYVGEGSEREQCRLLCSASFQSLPCYPQSNWALLVLIPSGWASVCSMTLWVSPMNSPARLGLSPAAALTPTGVFSQRL